MKVVHLSTVDFWGPGNQAYRLHKSLQNKGIDSTMVVLVKSSGDPSVKMVGFDPFERSKVKLFEKIPLNIEPLLNFAIEEWRKEVDINIIEGEGEFVFSPSSSAFDLKILKDIVSRCDVVHLHWHFGMLDFASAPLVFMGKPVILTLYDVWPFTGGCHFLNGCNGYLTGCNNCPLVGSDSNKPGKYFNIKKRCYELLNLKVVCPTDDIKSQSKDSNMFEQRDIFTVPFGVPIDVFTKRDKKKIRDYLFLPPDKKMILFCGSNIQTKRRGLDALLESLKFLDKDVYDSSYLVVIGAKGDVLRQKDIGIPVFPAGFVPHEEVLSWYMAAADVFVEPSYESVLPISAIEAMGCGTPVVGFDVIKEVVQHKENGYLAGKGDIKDLGRGISWILKHENINYLSRNATIKVRENFSLSEIAERYVEIYSQSIADKEFKDVQKLISWGEEVYGKNQEEFALEIFNNVLRYYGENVEVFNNIGVIYWNRGDLKRAREYFKKAISLDPKNEVVKSNLEIIEKNDR